MLLHVQAGVTALSCVCVSLQAMASCCTASAACGEMPRAAQQQHQPWSPLGSWPAPGAHSKCALPRGCFSGLVRIYMHMVPLGYFVTPSLPPSLSHPLPLSSLPPSLPHSLTYKLRWFMYAFQQQPDVQCLLRPGQLSSPAACSPVVHCCPCRHNQPAILLWLPAGAVFPLLRACVPAGTRRPRTTPCCSMHPLAHSS